MTRRGRGRIVGSVAASRAGKRCRNRQTVPSSPRPEPCGLPPSRCRRHEETIQPHEAAGQPDCRQASARGAPAGGGPVLRARSRGTGRTGRGPAWASRAGVCAKLRLGRCPLSYPEKHLPRGTPASLYSPVSPPARARRLPRKLRKLVFLTQCQARSFGGGVPRLSSPTRCCSLPPPRRACWSQGPEGVLDE